jgi:5-methylcytosine-specific restriction enzyme subunit McrC
MKDMKLFTVYEQREDWLEPDPSLLGTMPAEGRVRAFSHRSDPPCFILSCTERHWSITTNFYAGLDWLVQGKAAIHVEPKQNNDGLKIDYFGMLLTSLGERENLDHLEGLVDVHFDEPWIPITQEQDILSPILIVKFLKLVQHIVRKGLKKGYYYVTENLNCRIKGKILVGRQLKDNLVRSRLTNTWCHYQQYGFDTRENQLLKAVLSFVSAYLYNNRGVFTAHQSRELRHILGYCQPAFECVGDLPHLHHLVQVKKNPFYREYEEAVRIGGFILKRYSYSLSNTSNRVIETPPFWIDMSKLFELYVFSKLRKTFPATNAVTYHDLHNRKETDLLLRVQGHQCVIDCKYKPRYRNSSVDLFDFRQLAGYCRLRDVYKKLQVPKNELIKGLIIYPDQQAHSEISSADLFSRPEPSYIEFYRLGISLPQKTMAEKAS